MKSSIEMIPWNNEAQIIQDNIRLEINRYKSIKVRK